MKKHFYLIKIKSRKAQRFSKIFKSRRGKITLLAISFFIPLFCLPSIDLYAQSAAQLHQEAIVVDTHNDVISHLVMAERKDISHQLDIGNTDLPRLKKGGIDVQFFSIWCGRSYSKGRAFSYANREIDSLLSIIKRNPDKIALAKDYKDIKKIVQDKKIAAMIGVEGGHMIEGKLDYLDSLYKRGMRYMTLTWNNSTSWATSAEDETRHADTLPHKGLTDFGKKVVQRMNKLGVMVDLAHVGEQTFYDAIAASSKPVLVSHSSVYALDPVARNLKDDQIKAVAKNGGVICVNFYAGFVDKNYFRNKKALFEKYHRQVDSLRKLYVDPSTVTQELLKMVPEKEANTVRPPLSLLIDHIDYIVKLVGPDFVGLGADFDGAGAFPQQLDDVTGYPKITAALLKRGYSNEDIKKILGGNVLRVIKEDLK